MQKPREQQTDSSENRVKTKMAFSRVHASAKATLTHSLCLSLSLFVLTVHFPGEPGLAGVY